jgi:osmotically-inducible protein OsmY/DNA-directed RNA polymerase subunit M/transcription elongation factor TFIIS
MNCPNCNAGLSGVPKFCPKCGAKIEATTAAPPATKKCPQCGSENPLAAKFCKTDGYRFDSAILTPAVPEGEPRQEPSPVAVAAVASKSPATKKCPQCGSENALAAKFCKTDGYRFDSAIPTPTVPEGAPRQEPPPPAVAAATPDASDTVASPPGESAAAPELPPINPPHVPPAADVVICPKCGTANAASAKFCKKDGVALVAASSGLASNVGQATAATGKPNVARVEGQPSPPPVTLTKPPQVRAQQAATTIPQAKPASSRSVVAIATGVVAVLLAAGGGGYWYFVGRTPPTIGATAALPSSPASSAPPAPTQATPTRQTVDAAVTMILADAGLSRTIQSTTDADLVVTLYGSVSNEEQRASVLALVKSATGVTAVNDQLQVAQAAPLAPPVPDDAPVAQQAAPSAPSFDAAGVQQDLNRQLRNRGLSGVSVKVNTDRSAILRGKVSTAKEKEDAQILVSNSPELSGVRNTIQIVAEPPQTAATVDPAKLEGEINRALRNGGVGSVTAQVADDLSVTLKGSVTSAEQKNRAFQVARRFQARGMPKDRIFVIEQ